MSAGRGSVDHTEEELKVKLDDYQNRILKSTNIKEKQETQIAFKKELTTFSRHTLDILGSLAEHKQLRYLEQPYLTDENVKKQKEAFDTLARMILNHRVVARQNNVDGEYTVSVTSGFTFLEKPSAKSSDQEDDGPTIKPPKAK
jgi:hypothetical protein